MKTFIRRIPSLFVVLAFAATLHAQEKPAPEAPKPVDVAGKWTMTLNLEVGTATPTLVLKQAGEKLTGVYTGRYGEFPLEGTIKGKVIAFGFSMSAEGNQITMSFKGEVAADGQTMKGDATIEGLGDASWTAKKEKS